MYIVIRILIFVLIAGLLIILFKRKNIKKKMSYIIAVLVSVIVVSFVSIFPVENLVIDFQSPEDVFNYVQNGEIKNITHGNESCRIHYSGRQSDSILTVMKTESGYKIAGYPFQNIISTTNYGASSFNLVNIPQTNDYYLEGVVVIFSDTMTIRDEDGRVVEPISLKKTDTTLTCYISVFVSNYGGEGYELTINDERVFIKTQRD